MKLKDLTGQRFGALRVIRRVGINKSKKPVWEAICDCGTIITRSGAELRNSGPNASCGCRKGMLRRRDLSGMRFERLTVIRSAGHPKWQCLCECGNTHVVSTNDLVSGDTRSCGCLKHDIWKNNQHPITGKPSPFRKDWAGDKIHKLTFTHPDPSTPRGERIRWIARCDCGNTISVVPKSVVSGNTKSCGCARKEAAKVRGMGQRGKPVPMLRENSLSAVGSVFGKLTVTGIDWVDMDTYRIAFADCTCECGNAYRARLPDLRSGKTVSCGCGVTVSSEEVDLAEWLSQHVRIDTQYRLGDWLYDIAVPSARVLIEYNGAWWHSSKFTPRGKHQIKRRHAEDLGWRVINIWSDDWGENRSRLELLILEAIGVRKRRTVGARQFDLARINRDIAVAHHKANHVQRTTPRGGTHIGAFIDGTLHAVCTFKIGRAQVELTRYSLSCGLSAPGLLARILRYVDSTLPVVTFADRDYFTGALYARSGFHKEGTTLQLTYVDERNSRRRRESLMRHKLPALGIDVGHLSEREALAKVGIHQCWNSGIDKWVRPPSPSR